MRWCDDRGASWTAMITQRWMHLTGVTGDALFEVAKSTRDYAANNPAAFFHGKTFDRAEYDAIAESLFANAIDNRLVTLYDNAQPAPMSARTMRWNLKHDRIEINAPSPVRTSPGG